MTAFKAFSVEETVEGEFKQAIIVRDTADLPPGDLLIRVQYSSINYKDALSAFGNKGVTKRYPHTPGVDAAGVIEATTDPKFKIGDEVIVTGYDMGMNTCGGFGQYIRVPAAWAVKKPEGLSLKESMILGTAGFTAAQCVMRLQQADITPDQGTILVTGATGGVGCIAITLLAKLGYSVTAATGKVEQETFLRSIGAQAVIARDELLQGTDKALLKTRWAGAVDTVGGDILFNVIKSIQYRGAVTACGNVASPYFSGNVFPFILRGVSLIGIDSAECPLEKKKQLWQQLATEWKLSDIERFYKEITLSQLLEHLVLIKQGKVTGRIVINLQ